MSMLNVFITIDTEISTESTSLGAIQRDVYGATKSGEFGLLFQLDMLNAHGLRAVFFVDPFFACVFGMNHLCEIVELIHEKGHEVQLHIHTEWLQQMPESILPGRTGYNIRDFSENEQVLLIERGLEMLSFCGAKNICAFRAGNFGISPTTLRALARNSILYDSSYNICYPIPGYEMKEAIGSAQPIYLNGVYELPVSFFRDMPGHYRPTQICACSTWEMVNALKGAYEFGWHSFVIVSHTSEQIKRRQEAGRIARPNHIVIKRFEKLCRFLANNQDKFRTMGFSELVINDIPDLSVSPIKSNPFLTIHRLSEQIIKRLF